MAFAPPRRPTSKLRPASAPAERSISCVSRHKPPKDSPLQFTSKRPEAHLRPKSTGAICPFNPTDFSRLGRMPVRTRQPSSSRVALAGSTRSSTGTNETHDVVRHHDRMAWIRNQISIKTTEDHIIINGNWVSKKKPFSYGRRDTFIRPRVIDPFSNQCDTIFGRAYREGKIPCRLGHGAYKAFIDWTKDPNDTEFDPLVIYLVEGLAEEGFPNSFIAHQAFLELMDTHCACYKVIPLLPYLQRPFHTVLGNNNWNVCRKGLECLQKLSNVVGPEINPYLKAMLPVLFKRSLNSSTRQVVMNLMETLETNGGDWAELASLLAGKAPTYTSVKKLNPEVGSHHKCTCRVCNEPPLIGYSKGIIKRR